LQSCFLLGQMTTGTRMTTTKKIRLDQLLVKKNLYRHGNARKA
jgi:hypothetical protein